MNLVPLFISFLLHYSSLSFYGTIMPNCRPQLTFPQQEKHIQCCYILGRNNGAHKHFTKRKFMYNTAILLAVSPEEWTFQEKHTQNCYILGHNNSAYDHFCYDSHNTWTLFLISHLLSLGSPISYLLPPISRISYLLSLTSYLSDLLSPTPRHSHTHSTMTRLPLLYKYYIYG